MSNSQKMQPYFAKMFKRLKDVKEQCTPSLKTTKSWLGGPSARMQTNLIDLAHWPPHYLKVTFLISLCWLECYPALLIDSALSIVLDFKRIGKMSLSTGHCGNGKA